MPLVDSHCHLQDKAFDDDREVVVKRALEVLDWLVVIGDSLETSRQAIALTRPQVHAAVGIHPYDAASVSEDSLAELRAMARRPEVVAIGEIGLDYFKYNKTPREVQQHGFRQQLGLAAELGLPVVVHNRDSHEDLAPILGEYHASLPGGVMHCFAGGPSFVERCLKWGFYISFAGNVTFPKAAELRAAACAVPLERLLLETDSPYLAPQAVRGKRCEPAFVQHTCDFIAGLRGIDSATLANAATENAQRLFQVR